MYIFAGIKYALSEWCFKIIIIATIIIIIIRDLWTYRRNKTKQNKNMVALLHLCISAKLSGDANETYPIGSDDHTSRSQVGPFQSVGSSPVPLPFLTPPLSHPTSCQYQVLYLFPAPKWALSLGHQGGNVYLLLLYLSSWLSSRTAVQQFLPGVPTYTEVWKHQSRML